MTPIVPSSTAPALGGMSGVNGGAMRTGNAQPSKGGFSQLIQNYVQSTNESQVASDQSIQQLIEGKTDNVQQVVLAVANAEMSFKLFMEIRNKLIDSYNELMRMQF